MTSHPLVAALPAPAAARLTVYTFGPCPGEAIVVAMPDGSWIAIDSCLENGANVARLLLQRFGVKRLALAALTHPDADHYRGFADILVAIPADKVWVFPHALTRRQILANLARRNPSDRRWTGLSATLDIIDAAISHNSGAPVFALQSRSIGAAVVHCVAPCPADMAREDQLLGVLIIKVLDGSPITDEDGHLLRGRKLDGTGNGLSLAFVIEWGDVRVCLGGDVEAPASPDRGWNGVLSYVEAEGRPDLFDDVVLVKTAHHASEHAESPALYARLAKNARPVALITPFKGGKNPPPHVATLSALRSHCAKLGVTAEPAFGWLAFRRPGWSMDARTDDASACCVVASCDAAGAVTVSVHGRGRTFT